MYRLNPRELRLRSTGHHGHTESARLSRLHTVQQTHVLRIRVPSQTDETMKHRGQFLPDQRPADLLLEPQDLGMIIKKGHVLRRRTDKKARPPRIHQSTSLHGQGEFLCSTSSRVHIPSPRGVLKFIWKWCGLVRRFPPCSLQVEEKFLCCCVEASLRLDKSIWDNFY